MNDLEGNQLHKSKILSVPLHSDLIDALEKAVDFLSFIVWGIYSLYFIDFALVWVFCWQVLISSDLSLTVVHVSSEMSLF